MAFGFGFTNNSAPNFNIVSDPASPYTPRNRDLILIDATSGSKTVNLPNPSISAGLKFNVKKIDASLNTTTINPFSGELIELNASIELSNQGESLSIYCNGTDWFLL